MGEGGGITRVFAGDVIEKGGVNFSALNGKLSDKIAAKLKGGNDREFYATGVSLVIHPKNPFVPTVHMNVRYLERGEKQWFGGGIDLTPYYPVKSDIITFHKQLKIVCDNHNPTYYPEFKRKCDDYFFIKHRNEARGVGGIFFDYLSNDLEKTFQFVLDVGNAFNSLYIPLLSSYKNEVYSEEQRAFQQIRRGRYVEFNLVYDRGTLFGLETQGRIESILMSLPPQVRWNYNHQLKAGSPEAELSKFLVPQDWANME
ncbi:uncharacterized protein METZ01_LOCUS131310 [marine metagenome]|uniref:coproporphyrinogen oxidase n=1 Tax=marine metagenome TaxID=408172 RepID=A0A381YN47_9ZZZZ